MTSVLPLAVANALNFSDPTWNIHRVAEHKLYPVGSTLNVPVNVPQKRVTAC